MPQGTLTYTGILVALAPTFVHILGLITGNPELHLTPNFGAEVGPVIDNLVQLIGGAIATYGRLRATVPGWIAQQKM